MERLNDIEKQNKLNILKMMFSELEQIDTENRLLYSYPFEKAIRIVDEEANIVAEIDTCNQKLCGRYIIEHTKIQNCEDNSYTLVTNIETNKSIKIEGRLWGCEHVNDILNLEVENCTYLLNSRLEIIFKSGKYNGIYYKYSDSKSHRFMVSGYRSTYKLRVNKKTQLLEAYDEIELDNNYSLIGTELKGEYEHKEAVRIDRNEEIRYKLAFNGTIISDKSYCDIIKNIDIQNSPYFYCVNINFSGAKIGVLDNKGIEIIPPIYKNIQHLNNGIFMVELDRKRKIINTTSNYESEQIDNDICYIHDALPIIMFVVNNEWCIYDSLGRIYKAVELANKFECKYCSQQQDYIKININLHSSNPVYKYITRNFETVTDFRMINWLNTFEWI